MDNQLCWVEDCGIWDRAIFAITGKDMVYIGCYKGTFGEAEERIRDVYGRAYNKEDMDAYIAKLHELRKIWEDPDYVFDPDRFDWEMDSPFIVRYAPQHFDPDRYNWADDSALVAEYAPQFFDPEKYDWKADSDAVAQFAPQFFDPKKYDWEKDSWAVAEHAPHLLDPKKYNWEKDSWAVELYCPEKFKLKPKGV